VKARTHRKAVIKHLYTFCREKGLLSRAEDPTLDLALPQTGVSKKKRAVTREEFERTFEKLLEEQYRDVLTLQGGTAMHITEAQRLARGQGFVGADSVAIQHKRGTLHRQVVRPEIVAAARRVQERGSFSISRYSKAVRKAAREAGVRPWSPGGMRTSVTTWLLEDGATMDAVSTWLGHLSLATTKKFYARWATIPLPGSMRAPLRLVEGVTG
jgi:integrase